MQVLITSVPKYIIRSISFWLWIEIKQALDTIQYVYDTLMQKAPKKEQKNIKTTISTSFTKYKLSFFENEQTK